MAKGQMLVETDLDGSVWTVLAGKWNPSSNRDDPDGFWGGRRPTFRGGGLGGGSPPS